MPLTIPLPSTRPYYPHLHAKRRPTPQLPLHLELLFISMPKRAAKDAFQHLVPAGRVHRLGEFPVLGLVPRAVPIDDPAQMATLSDEQVRGVEVRVREIGARVLARGLAVQNIGRRTSEMAREMVVKVRLGVERACGPVWDPVVNYGTPQRVAE